MYNCLREYQIVIEKNRMCVNPREAFAACSLQVTSDDDLSTKMVKVELDLTFHALP